MKRSKGLRSRYRAIGSPTKAEQRYQDAARELGCVVCLLLGSRQACGAVRIHHRTTGDLHGQKQLGQDAVVSLGDWHHQGVLEEGETVDSMRARFGPSLHHHKRDFLNLIADTLGERSTGALQRYQDTLLPVEVLL